MRTELIASDTDDNLAPLRELTWRRCLLYAAPAVNCGEIGSRECVSLFQKEETQQLTF